MSTIPAAIAIACYLIVVAACISIIVMVYRHERQHRTRSIR